MLRIVTGAFHPELEGALYEHLHSIKQTDPLAPVAIVVPSTALRRRLQWLLCAERSAAFIHLHILTFHQLSRKLLDRSPGEGERDRSSVVLFHEVVRQCLRKSVSSEPDSPWQGLVEMPGAWAALWASCKDLKDAAVDPTGVLDAVEAREPTPPPALAHLLRLYADVRDTANRIDARDPDDLVVEALAHVERSRFLQSLSSLAYYGCYDLTQVQWDLFRSIARHYPTHLFFPLLRGHRAFAFAERFFERYVHGLIQDTADWTQLSRQATPQGGCSALRRLFAGSEAGSGDDGDAATTASATPFVQLVDTAGPEDEVTFVAKDILRLVEGAGYAFHEIGVVGRTLAGYESLIPRIFREQQVPYVTTLTQPLAAHPLVHAALLLLDVKRERYRRDLVIDLFASPFVAVMTGDSHRQDFRPDLWDVASRLAGVARGLHEWQRLAPYLTDGLSLPHRDVDEDQDGGPPPVISGRVLGCLLDCLRRLDESLMALPDEATWETYRQRIEILWVQWLSGSDAGATVPDEPSMPAGDLTPILEALEDLSGFSESVTFAELVSTLHRIVQEERVPVPGQSECGVQVLDAMTARGLPFRALYVVNLNERVFPRHIREDAFLRDVERRFLETDLGYKVPEKLAGFDEEQLLFWLVANSATERVVLLTPRSDDKGRPVIPSLYLDDIRAACGEHLPAPLSIPRRWAQRQAHPRLPHFQPEWLTPREMVVGAGFARSHATGPLIARLEGGAFLPRGFDVLRSLDHIRPRLGEHDGMIGHVPALWQRLVRRVSPTSLQSYGVCPFQYFARHVLKLRAMEEPEEQAELGPADIGTLAHAILRDVHLAWRREGHAAHGWQDVDIPAAVARAAASHFEAYARARPVGYPLLWELTQTYVTALVSQVLREDLEAMRTDGWQPLLFESPVQGDLPIDLPSGRELIHCEGQVDRVDWSSARKTYRIVDYKYKTSRTAKTIERNLALAAVRGRQWQPPLYLVMMEQMLQQSPPPGWPAGITACEGVSFFYLAPNWRDDDEGAVLAMADFSAGTWAGATGARVRATLAAVLDHIRAGRFFITPGGECEFCDYRPMCRLHHQPSWWRARADHDHVEAHRRMRHATVEGGTSTRDSPASTGDTASSASTKPKGRRATTKGPSA